jgi:hypothetical protein
MSEWFHVGQKVGVFALQAVVGCALAAALFIGVSVIVLLVRQKAECEERFSVPHCTMLYVPDHLLPQKSPLLNTTKEPAEGGWT